MSSNLSLGLTRPHALQKSNQSVEKLRALIGQRDSLNASMEILRQKIEGGETVTDEQQVCLSVGQSLLVFAGTHIDAALSCLAHNGKAFGAIKSLLEPQLAVHFEDSARDDIAYAHLFGLTADNVSTADMLLVDEHVKAATALHARVQELATAAGV